MVPCSNSTLCTLSGRGTSQTATKSDIWALKQFSTYLLLTQELVAIESHRKYFTDNTISESLAQKCFISSQITSKRSIILRKTNNLVNYLRLLLEKKIKTYFNKRNNFQNSSICEIISRFYPILRLSSKTMTSRELSNSTNKYRNREPVFCL